MLRHRLGGFIISAVALAGFGFAALSVCGIRVQPLMHSGGFFVQASDALLFTGLQVGFKVLLIGFAMALQHGAGGGFQFFCLMLEVSPGAAFAFGGIAG